MHLSSTVGKVFPVFRPGFLLTIFLDVAIAIIDEDTNLTRHEFIALLHPYKLPVVVYIEIKCNKCGAMVTVNLALRQSVKRRTTVSQFWLAS